MKKIVMFVWNNFKNDDRVKKKARTLSKKFDVTIYCVPKPSQYTTSFELFEKRIKVNYINLYSMADWLYQRLVLNESFWENVINDFDEVYDFVDCNDPDTLYAGVYLKKWNPNIKIVYDSHEYWKGTRRKETFITYTIYAYIGNYIQYLREKKYVKYFDKMITVSNTIAKKLKPVYNKPIIVIPNFCEFRKSPILKKDRSAIFVGSYLRPGVYDLANELYDDDYKIIIIGNTKPKYDWVTYLGYLPKKEYLKKLDKAKLGICYMNVDHDNMRFTFPNKLSEYIQTNCILIVNKEMIEATKLVNKYKIGLAVTKDDFNFLDRYLKNPKFILRNRDKVKTKLIIKLNNLLKDKNIYNRFKKAQKENCWETIEKKLMDWYV